MDKRLIPITAALLAFVAFVSAYDLYWSIALQDSLYECELNPIGCWLIEMDDGGVALFMAAKLMGTTIVIATTTAFCFTYFRFGFFVCCVLAVAQGALLWFLNYGHLLNLHQ